MRGDITQLVAQPGLELRRRLHVRRTVEGVAHSAPESAASIDFRAAHRTGFEVPQDFVVRLRQQLLAQKRVGYFSHVTTIHDASILPSSVFTPSPAGPPTRVASAAASSARSCARPRWS